MSSSSSDLDEEHQALLDRASEISRNQDLIAATAPIRPARSRKDDSYANLTRPQIAQNMRSSEGAASRTESQRTAAIERLAVFKLN